jgi:hypothetical protein
VKLSESTTLQGLISPGIGKSQIVTIPEALLCPELDMGTTSARQDVIASAEKANIFKHVRRMREYLTDTTPIGLAAQANYLRRNGEYREWAWAS